MRNVVALLRVNASLQARGVLGLLCVYSIVFIVIMARFHGAGSALHDRSALDLFVQVYGGSVPILSKDGISFLAFQSASLPLSLLAFLFFVFISQLGFKQGFNQHLIYRAGNKRSLLLAQSLKAYFFASVFVCLQLLITLLSAYLLGVDISSDLHLSLPSQEVLIVISSKTIITSLLTYWLSLSFLAQLLIIGMYFLGAYLPLLLTVLVLIVNTSWVFPYAPFNYLAIARTPQFLTELLEKGVRFPDPLVFGFYPLASNLLCHLLLLGLALHFVGRKSLYDKVYV